MLYLEENRVSVTPKVFDVLAYLVVHAGRVVSQDEILEALWPETYVNPEVLRRYILEIRKALDDRPEEPVFIETVPKRGYRFVAPVTDEVVAIAPSESLAEEQPSEESPSSIERHEASAPHREAKRTSLGVRVGKFALVAVIVAIAVAIGVYFRFSRSQISTRPPLNTSIAVRLLQISALPGIKNISQMESPNN